MMPGILAAILQPWKFISKDDNQEKASILHDVMEPLK